MSNPELEAIYNFCQVNERLGTAGQPTVEQFPAIKAAGYELVINLAAGTGPKDIPEERQLVAGLGLDYHHIPVDWSNPTHENLESFFALMSANEAKKVFVHCIANYRVSAFTMLYRVIKLGVPLAEAKALKDSVWDPEDVYPNWDVFIADMLKRYAIEP